MNIIILFESDKQNDDSYCLTDSRAEHIRTILKSAPNDILEIGILNGQRGNATVESIDENKVVLSNLILENFSVPNPTIDIIVALPRPQTVKKVLFTSAMMGVRNIFFIRSNRVEKSFFHSVVLEEANLREHLIEGLQQGKNTMLPSVSIYEKFKPFFEDSLQEFYSERNESPLMLLPDLDTTDTLQHVIPVKTRIQKDVSHLLFAIGPEGGWVPFEVEMMESLGFQKFKLGDWTLRVEHALTACIAQVEMLY